MNAACLGVLVLAGCGAAAVPAKGTVTVQPSYSQWTTMASPKSQAEHGAPKDNMQEYCEDVMPGFSFTGTKS
jgi:hypothetical protein